MSDQVGNMSSAETPHLITPDEARRRMAAISREMDVAEGHRQADDLLVSIIRQHGYGDAADEFEKRSKEINE